MRDGICEVERLEIEPSEIGGFDGCFDADAGDFAGEVIEEEIAIAAEVSEQCLTPGFAVAVGGFAGGEAEGGDFGDDAGAGANELGAEGGIADDREGGAEAGDVVGFAGRHESHGARGDFGRERGGG